MNFMIFSSKYTFEDNNKIRESDMSSSRHLRMLSLKCLCTLRMVVFVGNFAKRDTETTRQFLTYSLFHLFCV